MCLKLLLKVLCLISVVLICVSPGSMAAWAAPVSESPPLLTLDIFKQRLKNPETIEGKRLIDLHNFTIDLRSQNAEFKIQFYQQLKSHLNQPGNPIGLEISHSVILGEFSGNDLGLRVPLYGESLSPMFTEEELSQIKRDRLRLSQLTQLSRSLLGTPASQVQISVFRGAMKMVQTRFEGAVNFNNTFFLNSLESIEAEFAGNSDWSESRFSQGVRFNQAKFQGIVQFRGSIFYQNANFNRADFQELANFTASSFEESGNFHQTQWQKLTNFSRVQWQGNADFSQAQFSDRILFTKAKFNQSLFLNGVTFYQLASFREAKFGQPVNLRGASILNQADFSDAGFAVNAYLNVAELTFDSDGAKIAGNTGEIGRKLSVPSLQSNETVLKNLVRNFRSSEQIPDANHIEYLRAKLRLKELGQRLRGVNINTATSQQLKELEFSAPQVTAILASRQKQPFRNFNELLSLEEIDLATYVKVSERAFCSPRSGIFAPVLDMFQWLGLSLLLLLSAYGTSSGLVFGVGTIASAYFALLFWIVDRFRRRVPQPILPHPEEIIFMGISFTLFMGIGLLAIFNTPENPWFTLSCLAVFLVPLPVTLLIILYWRGRYHKLLNVSYFMEDGSMRQLRLAINRLPIMPRFPLFRDRYYPILWNRRWSWLNYYDFSLNNLFKFGFNDIRVRDEHLPGLVSTLVWYQWSLGILYLTLLLWTLSRTIPGLNLLIYLK
jgi:hypothetical protein